MATAYTEEWVGFGVTMAFFFDSCRAHIREENSGCTLHRRFQYVSGKCFPPSSPEIFIAENKTSWLVLWWLKNIDPSGLDFRCPIIYSIYNNFWWNSQKQEMMQEKHKIVKNTYQWIVEKWRTRCACGYHSLLYSIYLTFLLIFRSFFSSAAS